MICPALIASTSASRVASPALSSPMPGALSAIALPTNFYIGAFGKDRVKVRGHDHDRPASGALAQGEDIAFGIDAGIEPALAKQVGESPRPRLFLERRRRNFGDPDDVGDPLVVPRVERRRRCPIGGAGNDAPDGCIGIGRCL